MRVQCPHCGAKLKVSEKQAGREGTCPRCRKKLKVPPAPEPELKLAPGDDAAKVRPPYQLLEQLSVRPPPPQTDKEERARRHRRGYQRAGALDTATEPPRTGERRLPLLVDILLYPASLSGLLTLGAVVLAALWAYAVFSQPVIVTRMHVPWGLIGLYLVWYLAECVYDSATGGTRAPTILDVGRDWESLLSRIAYLIAVYVLFTLPPILYGVITGRIDAIFWAFVAGTILFLPMGLLAMVIHDSPSVFNPLYLLGAILSVPGPYLALMLSLAGLAGLFWYGNVLLLRLDLEPALLILVDILVGSYTLLILAHLLGRFYWRYRDRLDWGV